MKHIHYTDVDAQIPQEEGVKDTTIRWLIDKKDGAPNFAMRFFEIKAGGNTPLHQHDWEHEVFIISGSGTMNNKDSQVKFKSGDVFFVKPNEWHQFINDSQEPLRFLCLVPNN